VAQHRAKLDSVLRPDAETRPDQVLALRGDGAAEGELGVADLVVPLEGDISADHVVEQDAKAPDGEGVAVVAAAADPLGRGVHAGAVKVGVGVLLVVGARPEVDELELARLEVHDEVLVLEVAVHDALAVAGQHGLHHLAEEAPSELLLQHPLLRDQVEQVLGGCGSLHDVDEGVRALVEVQELDDPLNVLH